MVTPGLLLEGTWTHPVGAILHAVRSPFSGETLGEVVISELADVLRGKSPAFQA